MSTVPSSTTSSSLIRAISRRSFFEHSEKSGIVCNSSILASFRSIASNLALGLVPRDTGAMTATVEAAPSYASGPATVPLLEETIGACLRRAVERFPGREALVCREQGFRATYAELWELAGLAARGLLARGIEKGDRIGIWAPNRFEWV